MRVTTMTVMVVESEDLYDDFESQVAKVKSQMT